MSSTLGFSITIPGMKHDSRDEAPSKTGIVKDFLYGWIWAYSGPKKTKKDRQT